jgi:hypothetical protein
VPTQPRLGRQGSFVGPAARGVDERQAPERVGLEALDLTELLDQALGDRNRPRQLQVFGSELVDRGLRFPMPIPLRERLFVLYPRWC